MKSALIIGITGQDGSYLAELLLEKGYMVYGLVRRSSTVASTQRIDHLLKDTHEKNAMLHRIYGDLTDSNSIISCLKHIEQRDGKFPEEIYNLGAQSHVRISFDNPEYTCNVTALGALKLLDVVRFLCPKTRIYQASSSEIFSGDAKEIPQSENTPFNPQSPYGCAKVFAHYIFTSYRKAYGMYAVNGILFNHESERRGETFVTRKITRALTRIRLGVQEKLYLGNLDSERDWGYAKDYVEAMWLMLQQDKPEDYVIGTGEKHSVREFLEECAKYLGMNIHSNGKKGVEEKYLNEDGRVIVEIDPYYFRPSEINFLQANYEKARLKLGWNPKMKFKELIKIMIDHDFQIAARESCLKEISP